MSLIILIAGNPGTGKTLQTMMHKDSKDTKKIIIDIENKADNTYHVNYKNGVINDKVEIFNPRQYDADYNIDYIKTYQVLNDKLNSIKKSNSHDIIIIDSLNYLRNPICSEYYKQLNNKKGIMENAWREVNGHVQDLIFPLAQYARFKDKTLIFTCHLKDQYVDNQCVGRVPDVKEWVEHLADIIIVLESDKDNYVAKCVRSSCGYWESDISGLVGLDVLLDEKGLI